MVQKSFYLSYRTIQSLRSRVAWSYMHHMNPSRIFTIFFFRKETLLTLLNGYKKTFTNLFFSFLAEIPYGKDHYQTFLHLTVLKILVQLTLLISKTWFWVWVLDWSVRHILFWTWIIGLFHYHLINNGSCHAIIGHLGLS